MIGNTGGAAQVLVAIVWETLLVRWYGKNLVRFIMIYDSKTFVHLFNAALVQ